MRQQKGELVVCLSRPRLNFTRTFYFHPDSTESLHWTDGNIAGCNTSYEGKNKAENKMLFFSVDWNQCDHQSLIFALFSETKPESMHSRDN